MQTTTITKKAANAARIEKNRQDAFVKKVRALVGYVGERLDVPAAIIAYRNEVDALLYAAEIVAREPVGAAVWPQKADSVAAATAYANSRVEKNLAKLEAVGWDANKIAVYPKHVHYNSPDRAEHDRIQALHTRTHAFVSVAEGSEGNRYSHDAAVPCIVARDEEKILRFVTQTEEATADLYNEFICKLVGKVGPGAVSATLEGNHVWDKSTLTVTMLDGSVQVWMTQQITNRSVLGKYFPQWPSRQVKGGAK